MNPDKKKIIYITVRSDHGGGPYHIDLLLSSLSDNFNFYIAAPLNNPYGFKWKEQFGTNKFFEIPFRSFNVFRFVKLISFVKRNSIGIVHSHGKGAGFYSRFVKIFLPGITVIHTFHGFHIQEYNFLTKIVYLMLERILDNLTNLFINVSKGEKQICLDNKIFKDQKSVVIYNAISPVKRNTEKLETRKQLSLPVNKFIVISVTRFNYQKNLPLFLSIAEKFLENEKFYFIIIGDGEKRPELEETITLKKIDNIHLLSSKQNVDEYLAASDVYLSTSFWEGLPYSLIEATAFGLPIIASNVTGNNEVVTNNVNGYLFELNHPDKAVNNLLELKNSPDKLKTFSQNSLRIFEDKFQLDRMIEKMKEVYKNFE